MVRRINLIVSIIIFSLMSLFSIPSIEFQAEIVAQFETVNSVSSPMYSNGQFWVFRERKGLPKARSVVLNLSNLTLEQFPEFYYPIGFLHESLIVFTRMEEIAVLLYSFTEKEGGNLPFHRYYGDYNDFGYVGSDRVYYYQNDLAFINRFLGNEPEIILKVNTITNEYTVLPFRMKELSKDKLHGIGYENIGREFYYYIIDPETLNEKNTIRESTFESFGDSPHLEGFITNSILTVADRNRWILLDLEGKPILETTINANIDMNREYFKIRPIKNSTYAYAITNQGLTILDISPLFSHLQQIGWAFTPTTGRSTTNRLRVRENPNLEAQTYGYLSAGDEVEVLDRSGIQVEIGDMKDYWYKIRNDEGLEGWAYGFFLELDEPEEDEE